MKPVWNASAPSHARNEPGPSAVGDLMCNPRSHRCAHQRSEGTTENSTNDAADATSDPRSDDAAHL